MKQETLSKKTKYFPLFLKRSEREVQEFRMDLHRASRTRMWTCRNVYAAVYSITEAASFSAALRHQTRSSVN